MLHKYPENQKKFSGKIEICFFCQCHKKFSSDQINRLLPFTGYTHRWKLGMEPSLYLSIAFLVFQYLSQFLDHGSWITRWRICCPSILWQTKFCHACQSCSPRFTCLYYFKDGLSLPFALTLPIPQMPFSNNFAISVRLVNKLSKHT